MGAANRAAEAERAALAYQAAMVKIGASVVADVLLLWKQEVPTTGGAHAATSWLKKVVALVLGKRREARALSRSFYRLDRALRLGFTVSDASDPDNDISLNDLRSEFRRLAGPDAPAPSNDNPTIPIEHIPGLDADALRQDREAAEEVRVALSNLGPANLEDKLAQIDTSLPANEVDAERQKAHDEAGARAAAATERIVLNGGRGDLWTMIAKDKRALGYIRISRTGTPCGWCAMLISRGPVYKSERSATTAVYGDGDLYHDNCHCYAVPVYSRSDYQTSSLYALNREYSEMWPKVTKGLGGQDALSAWRRYIRTQQRSQAGRA